MSDMKFTPSPGKLKLTSLTCACLGTLTILGLGFGVFTCVSALSPGNNQPVYAADPTQQVDLSYNIPLQKELLSCVCAGFDDNTLFNGTLGRYILHYD
jgi:hypothetical protein